MTRKQREAHTANLTPTTTPTPRIGNPRGADISHVGLCCSGSGNQVPPHRYFQPGMDARFKGWMLKLVRKSYAWEAVADEAGQVQGVISALNYKGEDNPRYIEVLAEGRILGPVDSLGRLKATKGMEVEAEVTKAAPKARGGRKPKEVASETAATIQ
jgi:hypothetical protein